MQEWKASEKETQKMTRDGAISVNLVTGEASHISDRVAEQDYSSSQDAVELTGKIVDRAALHGERAAEKKSRKKQRKVFREGEAAASRPSSRLQFSEEERAAPELQKAIQKSDKAADKLDAARAAIPKKRTVAKERTFDEETGRGQTKLVFKETDQSVNLSQHANPLSRPLQELGTAAHGKVREVEQENSGVQAGHLGERSLEKAVGYGNRRIRSMRANHKLKPWRAASQAEQEAMKANADFLSQKAVMENPELAGSNPISRIWHKKRMQRQYAAAYRTAAKTGQTWRGQRKRRRPRQRRRRKPPREPKRQPPSWQSIGKAVWWFWG